MSTLIEHETNTYGELFASVEAYQHSPGSGLVPAFMQMAGVDPDKTFKGSVLDAGTGSGRGAVALRMAGFNVMACDLDDFRADDMKVLTIPFRRACLWDDLRPMGPWFDYVYCCDVLEHIRPEFTMLVVRRLLEVSRQGVFLSIALGPDKMGVWVGEPLHKTVRSFTWWRDNLGLIGTVVEARDCMDLGGLYFVKGKGC